MVNKLFVEAGSP